MYMDRNHIPCITMALYYQPQPLLVVFRCPRAAVVRPNANAVRADNSVQCERCEENGACPLIFI